MEVRLIDANVLIADWENASHECSDEEDYAGVGTYTRFIQKLYNAPTVEPKRGEWIDNWVSTDEDLDGYFDGYRCLERMEVSDERENYCPNCGADMREIKK